MVEVKEPTQEQIDELKKKYSKIYRVVLSGVVYIYRFLKRSEFKEIQKSVTPEMTPAGPVLSQEQSMDIEDKVAKKCVVWPENFVDLVEKGEQPAAVTAVLAAYITDASGAQIEAPPAEL